MSKDMYLRSVVIAAVLMIAPVSVASATTAATPASQETGSASLVQGPKTAVYEETLTAHRTAGTDGSAGTQATITCTIHITPVTIVRVGSAWGPYTSTAYTSIGGAAWVTCTAVVPRLTVNASLAYGGMIDSMGPAVQRINTTATPNAYVIDLCSSGNWQVGGAATVQWPPGYTGNPTWAYWGPSLYLLPSACN